MADSNSTLQSILGTGANAGQSTGALRDIATNGKLINQNLSQLTTVLQQLATAWGA
jgi:hypothetical protein